MFFGQATILHYLRTTKNPEIHIVSKFHSISLYFICFLCTYMFFGQATILHYLRTTKIQARNKKQLYMLHITLRPITLFPAILPCSRLQGKSPSEVKNKFIGLKMHILHIKSTVPKDTLVCQLLLCP